ncbi:MAG: rhodanese-like domain-containing protein [Betaproteobacteria bacterium]|jgi:rhodanese-related sulfurtransferase
MKQLSVTELAQWLSDPARPQPLLLDVREPWEHQICQIEGAQLVPMRSIPTQAASLDPAQTIVCICHHGGRSAQVAMFLMRHGFGDVYNLAGGVDAWARQVDRAMATY